MALRALPLGRNGLGQARVPSVLHHVDAGAALGVTEEYRYFRWAGFLLRLRPADADAAEILRQMEWAPAPKEAVSDVVGLPDEHPPGGWCTRLSPTEAVRMAAGFGVEI